MLRMTFLAGRHTTLCLNLILLSYVSYVQLALNVILYACIDLYVNMSLLIWSTFPPAVIVVTNSATKKSSLDCAKSFLYGTKLPFSAKVKAKVKIANADKQLEIVSFQQEDSAWMLTILIYRTVGIILRSAISANHQISLLVVIFAIVKFANHSMVCVARSIYMPAAYWYFDYKHRQ